MDQKFNMEAFVDKIAKGKFGMLSVIAACSLDANNVEKFIDYLGQQACIDARLSTQHMLGESLYNDIVELYGRLSEDKKSYTTGKLMVKLTSKQKNVLHIMRSTEETIVFSKGGGWWIGEHQTNGKLVFALLRGCLISRDSYSKDNFEIYYINETGIEALETGYMIKVELLENTLLGTGNVIVEYAPISERMWSKGDEATIRNGQIRLGGCWFNFDDRYVVKYMRSKDLEE